MKRKTTKKRNLKLKRATVARLDRLDGVAGAQDAKVVDIEGYGFSLNRNNCGTSATS